MGLIQNYKELATNRMRGDVLDVIEAGLQSIQPENVMWSRFLTNGSRLRIVGDAEYEVDFNGYESINAIAVGKGAATIMKHVARRLRTKLDWGYVIDSVGQDEEDNSRYPNVIFRQGSHPLPTRENAYNTREIVDYLKNTSGRELTMAIICGGASAMFTDPYIGADRMAELTSSLIRSGADISKINTVRKHVDGVKGGNLARLLYRDDREILSLLFSDVPTVKDPKSFIASGPTVMDETTNSDALDIISAYKIKGISGSDLVETPKDPKYFVNVRNIILLDNKVPLGAMEAKAREIGYKPRIVATNITGEARKISDDFIRALYTGQHDMLLAGGETTVKVRNKNGLGGRNREVVLGSLMSMKPDIVVASVGTDGVDYVKYAGAIADWSTMEDSGRRNMSVEKFLDDNDSQRFFEEIGGNIYTGRMPSNVADLMVFAMKKPDKK
jgi:glycerate-2-kinase